MSEDDIYILKEKIKFLENENLILANKYYQIIDNITDGLCITSENGNIIEWNKSLEQLTEYSKEEFIDKYYFDVYYEIVNCIDKSIEYYDNLKLKSKVIFNSIKENQAKIFESSIITKKGKIKLVEFTIFYIKTDSGNRYGCVVRDITENKKLITDIDESNNKLLALMEFIPAAIYVTDINGDCDYINPKWAEISGLTIEEARGKGWVNGIFYKDRELVFESWYKMIESNGNWGLEYRFQDKEGKITPIFGYAKKLINKKNEVYGYIGVNFDITELNKAKEELHSANFYNRSLIETSIDPFLTISNDNIITDINEATIHILGFSREQIIGSNFCNYFANVREVEEFCIQVFNKGFVKEYENEIINKFGQSIPVQLNSSLYKDTVNNYKGAFITIRDISKIKIYNEIINENIARLNIANQIAKIGSWEYDFANKKIKYSGDVYDVVKDLSGVFCFLDEIFWNCIYDDSKKDYKNENIINAIRNINSFKIESEVNIDNIGIKYYESIGRPFFNINSNLSKYYGVTIDITERKTIENLNIKSVIESEEKQKSNFAYGLHEDLIPLISTIKIYINQLKSEKISEEDKKVIIDYASMLMDDAVNNSRNIANEIMPTLLRDFGLKSAIISFCEKTLSGKNIDFILKHENYKIRPRPEIELGTYRIIAELIYFSINNNSNNIYIELISTNELLEIIYFDDTINANLENIINDSIFFKSIKSRVKSMDGNINFTQISDKRLNISIKIKLQQKN